MIQIHEVVQGTPEWFACRAGKATASMFATVMAQGRGGAESATRKTYMLRLAGEIITGEPEETYSNDHMKRGQVMEAEARERYVFDRDAELQLVGFISNGRMGASPDALIVGSRGALEVKTKIPSRLIDCILRDDAPPEHKAQCQGLLLVGELEWTDLAMYWPKMPFPIRRIVRDDLYITNLRGEIDRFNDELDALVERVRARGLIGQGTGGANNAPRVAA